jgi:ATP-dependent helicase/nuclease subunit B
VTKAWPDVVREQGGIDPAAHRNLLLESLAARWSATPPKGQIIAAGSTGSIPATADLLAVIAALPNGRVVLPGLMRALDAESWRAIATDQTHPQYNLARLLKRLDITPDAVQDWTAHERVSARSALIAEVMRPADTTQAWRALGRLPAGALDGIQRIDCTDTAQEAGVIALILRHALEIPGRSAALVTPDRNLARRVAAELRRWDIDIDDSAGEPLVASAPGGFLRLIAAMVSSDFAPVALLAVLKHPLAAGGLSPGVFRHRARMLERLVLRGARPGPGFAGLRAVLGADPDAGPDADRSDTAEFIDLLETLCAPLREAMAGPSLDLDPLVCAHIAVAQNLAARDTASGAQVLWSGAAGEMLAGFLLELRNASSLLPPVAGRAYPALLDTLMAGASVRPRHGRHPRLAILGLLEARLQHADLLVLGGLNEGIWPPSPPPDPWLSRPMRDTFGLALPERRIGLTAHDFVQAFAAPEIVLTRAAKTDGQPTVPSRWLTRLEAVLRGTGAEDSLKAGHWRALRGLLHQPKAAITIQPPAPCPPLAARPRRLSVTQIETWMRDPYAIYARHILKLRPLDPLDADPGAADRGTFIHKALELFLGAYGDTLPDDALNRLLEFGQIAFGDALARPSVRAFWWPRFERIAHWFIAQETSRRTQIAQSTAEASGRLEIAAAHAPFILTARADRIDRLADGSYEIIDYKTGAIPSLRDIGLGVASQLALEAAILREGGFRDLPAGAVRHLAYWRLSGGDPPGEIKPVKEDAEQLADAALDGLKALITAFDNPDTPYAAIPRPGYAPRFNDYAHLARLREWGGE